MSKMTQTAMTIKNLAANKKTAERAGSLLFKLFRFTLLFALCFVILYPIIYMLSVSFREPRDLYDPTVIWIPRHFTLENYKYINETMGYFKLLGNTLFISIVGTVLNVFSCALAGYGFARFKFKGKGILFAFVMFMIIVPPQNVSIPLFLQYSKFDWFGISILLENLFGLNTYANFLNTPMTLFIPAALGIGIRAGLFIYIFRQFFAGMPKELEDAAYIDGCGLFKTFFRIIIPNASGAFLSTFLFSFVWYYNDFFFTSMYFSNPETLSTALGSLKEMLRGLGFEIWTDPYSIVTQMQAASILTILPLVIIYMFLQKFFTESIEHSGIVG